MATHLFAVGERVSLDPVLHDTADRSSIFRVKTRMPHVGTQLQDRVRPEGEPYDGVVSEGQLTRIALG